MFVTIDRAAIESAIRAEYAHELDCYRWWVAESRYGTLAVSESWDDCQDAVFNYAERDADDEGDVECALAECVIRHATNSEVMDTLLAREVKDIEYRVSRDINYPEEFEGAFKRELVEFGYPENGFIEFDTTPWNYGEGTVRFEVTPQ